MLTQLVDAGLLDEDETGFHPHDWDDLQFESDKSTARVKAYRERKNASKRVTKKRSSNGEGNVSETLHVQRETVTVTAQDTEQSRADTEQNRTLTARVSQPTEIHAKRNGHRGQEFDELYLRFWEAVKTNRPERTIQTDYGLMWVAWCKLDGSQRVLALENVEQHTRLGMEIWCDSMAHWLYSGEYQRPPRQRRLTQAELISKAIDEA